MTVLDWNQRVVLIGEVGQAHDGSLGTAHAFIDAIADAGADAVKFQTHIAAAESRTDEPWRVKFSYADDTRYEYWKRMEFSPQAWAGLRAHAQERGLAFVSSPFSLEAVELLRRLGVAAWKVASGEVANPQLSARMSPPRSPPASFACSPRASTTSAPRLPHPSTKTRSRPNSPRCVPCSAVPWSPALRCQPDTRSPRPT